MSLTDVRRLANYFERAVKARHSSAEQKEDSPIEDSPINTDGGKPLWARGIDE